MDPGDFTTSDIIVDKLIRWGVDTVFGLIGDGVNPIIFALYKRRDKIRFIDTRHEEWAAFMASGYAKFTGRLGVCIGTTGPGCTNLTTGLYDAALDGASVVAITGTTFSKLVGTNYSQGIDTIKLFNDVAKYNMLISSPHQALHAVDQACRSALATRSLSHISIPVDVQMQKISEDKIEANTDLRGLSQYSPSFLVPGANQIEDAAVLLNEASRPLILVGKGAIKSSQEVDTISRLLGAPIVKSLLGRTVVSDEHPNTTQGCGHLGTSVSYQAMKECDVLLIVGCNMPYLDYYPDNAKSIQIDINIDKIGIRHKPTIGINADAKFTLVTMIDYLKEKPNKAFLSSVQNRMLEWNNSMENLAADISNPLKAAHVSALINTYLEDDAMISFDTGLHTGFASRHFKFKPTHSIALSGLMQSMGCAVPFCIAGKFAFKHRQSVCIVGDGGFTMSMAEVATAVKYGLDVKIIIYKNGILAMEYFEEKGEGFVPYGYELHNIDFALYAKACGAEGFSVKDETELKTTLDQFFASKKTCVLEIYTDPFETFADAKNF